MNLLNANLTNANLTNANLTNANLTNANLTNANLSNANVTNADLTNANVTNANLTNVIWDDVNLTNVQGLVDDSDNINDTIGIEIRKAANIPESIQSHLEDITKNSYLQNDLMRIVYGLLPEPQNGGKKKNHKKRKN